ncbi:MAG: nickel-dependent lactate racemase [Myxococcota bacterium]|nr:nickel-dependent lactate racemase [Myxococcota bacterium]
MPLVASTLMMSGFDLRLLELPQGAKVLRAPPPLPALADLPGAVQTALRHPVAGDPLSERLTASSRVTVVVDDFTFPVPQAQRDCRRELLAGVISALDACGVRSSRITVLIANGLSRQWRPAELTELLGPVEPKVVCHDAEAFSQLARIGELPEGPVELNKLVVEADLVIHLNVVSLPTLAGYFGLVSGTAGYRTARFLGAPGLFETGAAPFMPGSPYHALHEKVGRLLAGRTEIVQLSAVLDNALVGSKLAGLEVPDAVLSRPLQMWNSLPVAVRQRAARLLKASYRPFHVLFGDLDAVAPEARAAFARQHEVPGEGEADVLVFGVPDVGPGNIGTLQDPVLATCLALGYIAGVYTDRPLVREGGVVMFSNPLNPQFDRAHAPHQEFYEKVLRLERDPQAIHEKFEPYFAGRPEFVSGYQSRFGFHGTHPLFQWYLTSPARRRAGKVIVPYGDPRSCARLGFTPANDFEDGLRKASEFLGQPAPRVLVLQQPPPFWVRSGGA